MNKMPDPPDGCRKPAIAGLSVLVILCLTLLDSTGGRHAA